MTTIVKTLPARFARGELDRFFGTEERPCFTTYFFTLGRGRPNKANIPVPHTLGSFRPPGSKDSELLRAWQGIYRLFFCHRGVLIGSFRIDVITQNVGQLPLLTTLDGKPSEWQIKPDRWVAVCAPPFRRLEEKLFHEGFRGWRYFDLDSYRGTTAAKCCI